MKTCWKILLGLLVFLVGGASAHAQYPYARSGVSPWMNLYRGGSTGTWNYQNLVRPDLDFRSSIQALQQQSRQNQQGIADLQTAPNAPLTTGHQAGFMTQGSYFQTVGAGGTGIGATSMPIARTTLPGGGAATATRGGITPSSIPGR